MYRKNKNLLQGKGCPEVANQDRKSAPLEERRNGEAEISVSVFDRVRVGRLNEYFYRRKNIEPHPDRESMLEL